MEGFVSVINNAMSAVNAVLWHDAVLYIILTVGVLFLFWSRFSPFSALTHGIKVVLGRYDKAGEPGAISHFQALSAALSATVGLGNIGGVAVAIALGGPGAVFWMWIVGIVGMGIKMTEVTQSMIYRNTDDPDNPHGGPMWVVSKGLAEWNPKLAGLGKFIGSVFCITLLISAVTGGNMFQAWSVGDVTAQNFGVPSIVTGIILSVVCAAVIIGGIKRIGAVAGRLVPFMCGLYLAAGLFVIFSNITIIPEMILLIFTSAFNPTEAQGAFIGGTVGYAFLWGMKRALFSNEAGQGSAPIAHAAARTNEPVREGIVAGLEPFIDTVIVCTITALVILSTGAWNRAPSAFLNSMPAMTFNGEAWTLPQSKLPALDASSERWQNGQSTFVVVDKMVNGEPVRDRLYGTVNETEAGFVATWSTVQSAIRPEIKPGVYIDYASASLTSYAFDRSVNGLGRWLVTIAAWLFAISTMISWSYYGEQGIVFLYGKKGILPYKIVYCLLIVASTSGIISTTEALDNLTGIGTGVMLFANIPIMLLFARKSMRAYHDYMARLRSGAFG